MRFTEKDIEYYTWKTEIYASLMSGNIVSPDYPNRQQAIKEIQDLVAIADDELITKLLENENWRSRLVAGYLIGFKNKKSYIDTIGEKLVKGCGGITGYSYALARFADEKSIYYLTKFLDEHLAFDKYPNERHQYLAFRALRWIDEVNNTTLCQNYLGEHGLWTKFVEYEFQFRTGSYKLSDNGQWKYIDKYHLEDIMNFYKDHFGEK